MEATLSSLIKNMSEEDAEFLAYLLKLSPAEQLKIKKEIESWFTNKK